MVVSIEIKPVFMNMHTFVRLKENFHLQFISSLTDSSSLIRDAVRKVLKSVKLQNMDLFRLSVYGLIESMQRYHQVCV